MIINVFILFYLYSILWPITNIINTIINVCFYFISNNECGCEYSKYNSFLFYVPYRYELQFISSPNFYMISIGFWKLWSLSCHSGVYTFGVFTTTIFANAGQVVTGNQTPHFLSACRPNYTALGCHSNLQYIIERKACTGNPLIVASARKSFPSKDAALSVYSAVYTVVRIMNLQLFLMM